MKNTRLRFGFLLSARAPRYRGEVGGLPIDRDVEILRDRFGIPHIFAASERDLMIAQGFVHAQDRLWQMETFRRLAAGRVSELAGEASVTLDHFALLAGFDRMQRRALKALLPEERRNVEAYVLGINAHLASSAFRLPVEFATLKATPRPWTIDDVGGVLPVISWFLQANYQDEIAALLARERLDAELFNELYPSLPGEKLPHEEFFERYRGVTVGGLLPAAVAIYPELASLAGLDRVSDAAMLGAAATGPNGAHERTLRPPTGSAGGGSNNWVVRRGEGELPLVANDPHLGVMVPQVWHLAHLSCPTMNIAGFSMVGVPSVVIGRNEQVAWGFTNVQTDIVDLFMYKLDPKHSGNYLSAGQSLPLERREVTIPVAGGEARRVVITSTVEGPLITDLPPEGAVAALKWYGTLPEDFEDTTIHGILALSRARTVDELMEAGRLIRTAGQNIVAGDSAGDIAWHSTGLAPVRSGYSGRTPADGSSGTQEWKGFLAYEEMPASKNPREGWIATANNKVQDKNARASITYSWNGPYRRDRIASLLEPLAHPTAEDFRAIQMDIYCLQAERLLPRLLSFAFHDERAVEAQALLRNWDRLATAKSTGALVFSCFLTELGRLLTRPLLGEASAVYMSVQPFFYTIIDSLLSGGPVGRALAAAGFGGSEGEASAKACEQALCRAVDFIESSLGRSRRGWKWGRLHTHLFAHQGARTPMASWLLNRGPYPAPGAGTTVNVSLYNSEDRRTPRDAYRVVTIPSMRFIASLASPDRTLVYAPMGQSGRPGNRHYDDMIPGFLRGDMIPFPLSRGGAEGVCRERLLLSGIARPGKG